MRRKVNVPFLLKTILVLGVLAGLGFGLHAWQLRRAAPAYLSRFERALAAKDYERARASIEQYLKLQPDDAVAREKYALLLDETPDGDPNEAFQALEATLRKDPQRLQARYRLLQHYIRDQQLDDVLAQVELLRERWPKPAEMDHVAGWAYEGQGKYAESAAAFRQALAKEPTRLPAALLLVDVLASLHKAENDEGVKANLRKEQDEVMDRIVAALPDASAGYLARYHYLRTRGRKDDAKKDLDRALAKRQPAEAAPVLAAAQWEFEHDKLERAQQLLAPLAQAQVKHEDVYKTLAFLQLRTGARDSALATLEQGVGVLPESFALRVYRADLLIGAGKLERARKDLDELRPTWTSPLLDFLEGQILLEQKNLPAALSKLESAARLMEGKKSLFHDWCRWPSRVYASQGLAYELLGDSFQRVEAYHKATLDDPAWTQARKQYAAALLDAGRTDEALDELEKLAQSKDAPPEAHLLACRAHLMNLQTLGASPERLSAFQEALALARAKNPQEALALDLFQVQLLKLQKKSALAQKLLDTWHARSAVMTPDEQKSLARAQAEFYVSEGRLDLGLKLLTMSPFADDPALLSARIRYLAERDGPGDRQELEKLAKSAAVQRDLARAWQRLGDVEQSRRAWQRLAQEAPGDLESRQALLELALAQRTFDEARELVEAIRRIDAGKSYRTAAAALALAERKLDVAGQHLSALRKLAPEWSRLALMEGQHADLLGDERSALAHFQAAIQQGEGDPRLLLSTARRWLLRRTQDTDVVAKLQELLRAAGKRDGWSPELKRIAAEVAALDDALGPLEESLAELVPETNRDYRDWLWKGRLLNEVREPRKAEVALRRATELAPLVPETWQALAEHLAFVESSPAKVETLLQGLAHRPAILARCLGTLGRVDDAAKAYRAALIERPNDIMLRWHAGDFFRSADQGEEARKCLLPLIDPKASVPSEIAARARRSLALLETAPNKLEAIRADLRGRTDLQDQRLEKLLSARESALRPAALAWLKESFAQVPPRAEECFEYAKRCGEAGDAKSAQAAFELTLKMRKTGEFLAGYLRWLQQSPDPDVERIETLKNELRVREPQGARGKAQGWLSLGKRPDRDFIALMKNVTIPGASPGIAIPGLSGVTGYGNGTFSKRNGASSSTIGFGVRIFSVQSDRAFPLTSTNVA